MTISAKVICHSRSPHKPETPDLFSLELRYPRFIHSEFMTHRVFSRNASSSRAVPVAKMIQQVIDDCAMPVKWGSNQPGMQAGEELDALVAPTMFDDYTDFVPAAMRQKDAWLLARDHAVNVARAFDKAGYHKQIVNRLIEPFAHISVIVSGTEWQNFFDLRCTEFADPTMAALAYAMRDAIDASEPEVIHHHLPYLPHWERGDIVGKKHGEGWTNEDHGKLAMVSAARCARVSYLNHDQSAPDIQKDLALAEMLLKSKHMSPFEHQAHSAPGMRDFWRNFNGWAQHRAYLEEVN